MPRSSAASASRTCSHHAARLVRVVDRRLEDAGRPVERVWCGDGRARTRPCPATDRSVAPSTRGKRALTQSTSAGLRAEVARERQHLDRHAFDRARRLRVDERAHLGAAEAVDRLHRVADGEQRAAVAGRPAARRAGRSARVARTRCPGTRRRAGAGSRSRAAAAGPTARRPGRARRSAASVTCGKSIAPSVANTVSRWAAHSGSLREQRVDGRPARVVVARRTAARAGSWRARRRRSGDPARSASQSRDRSRQRAARRGARALADGRYARHAGRRLAQCAFCVVAPSARSPATRRDARRRAAAAPPRVATSMSTSRNARASSTSSRFGSDAPRRRRQRPEDGQVDRPGDQSRARPRLRRAARVRARRARRRRWRRAAAATGRAASAGRRSRGRGRRRRCRGATGACASADRPASRRRSPVRAAGEVERTAILDDARRRRQAARERRARRDRLRQRVERMDRESRRMLDQAPSLALVLRERRAREPARHAVVRISVVVVHDRTGGIDERATTRSRISPAALRVNVTATMRSGRSTCASSASSRCDQQFRLARAGRRLDEERAGAVERVAARAGVGLEERVAVGRSFGRPASCVSSPRRRAPSSAPTRQSAWRRSAADGSRGRSARPRPRRGKACASATRSRPIPLPGGPVDHVGALASRLGERREARRRRRRTARPPYVSPRFVQASTAARTRSSGASRAARARRARSAARAAARRASGRCAGTRPVL